MGFLSSLGSGLGSAIGGLASGLVSSTSASKIADKSEAYSREAAQNAHQWEVSDLRAAGLNPILSATGGSGASALPLSQPMPDTGGFGQAGDALANTMRLAADLENIGAQTQSYQANSALARSQQEIAAAQLPGYRADSMSKIVEADLASQLFTYRLAAERAGHQRTAKQAAFDFSPEGLEAYKAIQHYKGYGPNIVSNVIKPIADAGGKLFGVPSGNLDSLFSGVYPFLRDAISSAPNAAQQFSDVLKDKASDLMKSIEKHQRGVGERYRSHYYGQDF